MKTIKVIILQNVFPGKFVLRSATKLYRTYHSFGRREIDDSSTWQIFGRVFMLFFTHAQMKRYKIIDKGPR